MAIEKTVNFLNIDLVIGGTFDRNSVVRALGDEVFALHERVRIDGVDSLVLELNVPNLDLTSTLDRLVEWVQGLPRPARREWDRASRRTFDCHHRPGWAPFPPESPGPWAHHGGEGSSRKLARVAGRAEALMLGE
jgi:hypothetical protein